MVIEYLLEYILFTFTVLAVWKGKEVFNFIKRPQNVVKFLVSLSILLVLTMMKSQIPNFYLSTMFTSINIIIIFRYVWKLDWKMSLITSLTAIVIVLFSDLVGYSMMIIIHANFKFAPYYFLLSRFLHALILAPVIHMKYKNDNPLLLIEWKKLSREMRYRFSTGLALVVGALFFDLTLNQISKNTADLRQYSVVFIGLALLAFGMFIVAMCVVFNYGPFAKGYKVRATELRNMLMYYKNVYDLKAYVDDDIKEFREIEFNYLISIIEKFSKEDLKNISIKVFKGDTGILTMLDFIGWIEVPGEIKREIDGLINRYEVTLEYEDIKNSYSISILEHI